LTRHHRGHLGGSPEQEVLDGRLVLERDSADRGQRREDDVIVTEPAAVPPRFFPPSPRSGGLTLRAVAIGAGIGGDAFVRAVLTALDVSVERGRGQVSIADITFN